MTAGEAEKQKYSPLKAAKEEGEEEMNIVVEHWEGEGRGQRRKREEEGWAEGRAGWHMKK
jgi:hypothetical protein